MDKRAALAHLAEHLAADGWLALAETVPRYTQRIYALGDRSLLQPELAERLIAAEESIYADAADRLVNWDDDTLQAALCAAFPEEAQAGRVSLERIDTDTDVRITDTLIRRWFGPALGDRKSLCRAAGRADAARRGRADRELDQGTATVPDSRLAPPHSAVAGGESVERLGAFGVLL